MHSNRLSVAMLQEVTAALLCTIGTNCLPSVDTACLPARLGPLLAFDREMLTEDGEVSIPPHYADLLKYGSQPITMSLAAQLGKGKDKGNGKGKSSPAGQPVAEEEEEQQQIDDQVGSRPWQLHQLVQGTEAAAAVGSSK